jgi:hypothetical protein
MQMYVSMGYRAECVTRVQGREDSQQIFHIKCRIFVGPSLKSNADNATFHY